MALVVRELAEEYNRKYGALLKACKCESHRVALYVDRVEGKRKCVWGVSCAECGECVEPDVNVKKVINKWNDKVAGVK